MAVIKADGYGHGAAEIGQYIYDEADYFGSGYHRARPWSFGRQGSTNRSWCWDTLLRPYTGRI